MYDFEVMADRSHIGNMKTEMTPEVLAEKGITSFAAAEMDFKTAPSVIEAVKSMADRGIYGFTVLTEEYRQRIKWWMREMRNWEIGDDWILPVMGTIFSVATAIRMTTDPGEGIIVQTPVYHRYEQAAERLGRKTVYNPLKIVEGCYEMDFEDLEAKMAEPRNRLFILCNAHNPIGRVWSKEDLERVAELASRYGVIVLSDEIFGEMTFDGHRVIPYGSLEAAKAHGITVISLGKAFNFTGVNHADVIISDEKLRQRYMKQRNADHFGSIGPFEYASVLGAYCEEGKQWFEKVRDYIQGNAHLVKNYIEKEIPKARVFPIEGTSVCWIDWSFLGLEGEALEDFFLKEALFAVESGQVYGPACGIFTRMNLSSPRSQVRAALERVKGAVARYE